MFIAFNINHSSILPLMALKSLYCADVPLSNYSLTHSLRHVSRFHDDDWFSPDVGKSHAERSNNNNISWYWQQAGRVYGSVEFKNTVQMHMLRTVPYSAIVTLTLRRAVSTIFVFQKFHDVEMGVKGKWRSLRLVSFDTLCIVSY